MSLHTAEAQPSPPALPGTGLTRAAFRLSAGRLYLALAAGSILIGGLSLLFPSTPSYDPWSWLIWGREIIHLDLHTTGGPSWKPLTVILTSIFALFGSAQPNLLLVVCRAGAVMAVAMAFRIAWRIARPLVAELAGDERAVWSLLPALFGALVAAASLFNSPAFVTDNALGYSEGLMTALVLVALDRHLDGARRQTFAIGFLAALDRPELWLLWGPYGLYLWWRDPGARWLVIGLFVMIPVLWFLPELWGSGHLFRGVTRAHHPRRNSAAFASCPFCSEFVHHAWPRVMLRVKAVGLVALAVAAAGLWRTRSRWWARTNAASERMAAGDRARLLLIAAGAIGWLWWLGVSVETQAGFSGNDRYLVLGTALIAISGGVGWGWAAAALARLLRGLAARSRNRRLGAAPAAVGGTALALAVGLATPPWIGPSVIDVPATHRALVYQAHLRSDLGTAVHALGGKQRILSCGTVMTEGFQVPMVAWTFDVRMLRVEAPPTRLVVPPSPSPGKPPPWPRTIFQARDTSHATLLPTPQQILAWEHDGARYRLHHFRTFYVFTDC